MPTQTEAARRTSDMQEAKRGKHERRRRSLFATLSRGKDAAARKLRRLPSIVTGENILIGKERV
jgi:hypothetical protein